LLKDSLKRGGRLWPPKGKGLNFNTYDRKQSHEFCEIVERVI